ncbi:MAG: ribbon-helix-helix domain-containing protein [Propionibacteriaceae bacterium]|nr:ribbon-helix-helix domain-containing protein [Propionibacteriaceae bacterium]
MNDYGTFQGRPLDDDYLAELTAEAEAGYEVDEIVRRRGGRPPLGDGPSLVVPVRLNPAQSAALTARIAASGKTRSEIVRDALDAYLIAA